MNCRILLTGFQGTSSEVLLSTAHAYDTLLLPNDKKLDGELLTDQLLRGPYDFVICLGQKPNMKDKIHIESTARRNGFTIQTKVDIPKLARLFGEQGIPARQSNHAGTSFCNALYFNGLRFVEEHECSIGVVFVHIPFLKNMSCPGSFAKRFWNVIDQLKLKGVDDLWIK